jgi:hypothetical protein
VGAEKSQLDAGSEPPTCDNETASGNELRLSGSGVIESGRTRWRPGQRQIHRYRAARSPSLVAMTAGLDTEAGLRAVILVEGVSDQLAVQHLALRLGRDLAGEGVAVIAMQGATNIAKHLRRYGPDGLGLRMAGLCDAGEAGFVGRALHRAGICPDASVAAMEAHGFFVCTRDLEDELIRAVGIGGVERVIQAQGEIRSLRTLQRQPAQRSRSAVDQLRRFMGGRSGNKHRYARLLVEALDLGRIPRPLERVLDRV